MGLGRVAISYESLGLYAFTVGLTAHTVEIRPVRAWVIGLCCTCGLGISAASTSLSMDRALAR